MKFTNYGNVNGALDSFWQHHDLEQNFAGIRVLVMPYTPTAEAHQLHELILLPDQLPKSYAETVETPHLGQVQIQHVEEEDDDELDFSIWDEREATVPLNGVLFHFSVVNYGLLWAKAEKFCLYRYICDAYGDIYSRLSFCDEHLHQPTPELLGYLRKNLLLARKHLIFAMYLNDTNPHGVILSFFPHVHDLVYLDCVHCDVNLEEADQLDPLDTMIRLYDQLINLGLHEYVGAGNLSLDEARVSLMCAEGVCEGYTSEFNAMQRFNVVGNNMKQIILPLLDEFHQLCHQPSVMGVPPPQIQEL